MHVLMKLIYLTTSILQVVLWPSIMTISAKAFYALSELQTLYMLWGKNGILNALSQPGPFILRRTGANKVYSYVFMLLMGVYYIAYAGMFIGHELSVQPAGTFWLDRSVMGNYTATPEGNPALPMDVTSSASINMRQNAFVWEKHFDRMPPRVSGAIRGVGPAGAPLECPSPLASPPGADINSSSAAANFACYAKIIRAQPPSGQEQHPFIPLPSSLYTVEVMVLPPPGLQCRQLEVYRVVLDAERNIQSGLDYPSSVVAGSASETRGATGPPTCGIFGNPAWCLQTAHTFTDAQYRQGLAQSCANNNGALILRLPARGQDIDYETGRIGPDLLLVTAGASVQLHAAWIEEIDKFTWFARAWKQLSLNDAAQAWRESTSSGDVLFKFMVAVSPMFIVLYYLASGFQAVIADDKASELERMQTGQVLLLCIFVLLPGILLYLSIGAWVPMAGCIICIIAVNHDANGSLYQKVARPALLFIFAACNSIQFAWLIALIAQAGYSAFCYETTLQQLYTLSARFIISDTASPTWIALVLPSVLLLTGACLLGTAFCVVIETLGLRTPSTSSSVV